MSRRMIVFVSPSCHVPPRDRVHLSIVSCPAARSCPPLHRFVAHRVIVLVSPSFHVPPHDRVRLSIVSCPTALPSLPLCSNSCRRRLRCFRVVLRTVLCCILLRHLWHIRCLSTAVFVSTFRRHSSAVIRPGLLRFEGGRARCCRPSALLSVPAVPERPPVLWHVG